jgi:hypothetical protein
MRNVESAATRIAQGFTGGIHSSSKAFGPMAAHLQRSC